MLLPMDAPGTVSSIVPHLNAGIVDKDHYFEVQRGIDVGLI